MKLKKEFVLVIAIFLIFSQFAFISAITGSMGNARMVLYPEVNGITNTIIEKSILVKNVNDDPITIRLEIDEDSVEFLELLDEEVTLEPRTEKRMEFKVKVKKPGKYEGKINVFFSSLNEDEPGVALASTIIIIAKNPKNFPDEPEEPETPEEPEDPITGDVISEKSREDKGLGVLLITTVILLVVLIVLYILSEKKRKKRAKEKSKPKKSKKSNEKPKKK